MKKNLVLKIFIVLSVVFLCFSSCKNEKNVIYADSLAVEEEAKIGSGDDKVFTVGNFFTPDYTPYEPEETRGAKKLSLSSPKSSGKSAKSEANSRNLSDYKVNYNTKPKDFKIPEITPLSSDKNAGDSKKSDEPFCVADWGPKDSIPSSVRFPSFYVLFSEPVVSLASLNQKRDANEYIKITPEIKGIFRWNGTSLLSFDTTEVVNPLQVYTITVLENVKSLSGKNLTGEREFKTEAAPLKIIWSAPGYSKNKWVDRNEVPPAFSKEFRVQFNYPVVWEEIQKISEVTVEGKKIDFTVKQEAEDTLTYEWTENIPFNSTVKLTVFSGNLSDNENPSAKNAKSTTSASFRTLSPFVFEYDYMGQTYGKYTNPLWIDFSHQIDEKSVLASISAKSDKAEDFSVTKENFEVRGAKLVIFGLPVTFHSTYTVEISKNLRDIYGRNLTISGEDSIRIAVAVPGAESKVHFTDSGTKMLESEFPHKMVFEYQNIRKGAYLLNPTENPFVFYDGKIRDYVYDEKNDDNRKDLKIEPEDERIFEVVNLDEKLTGKKGWVEFYSAVELPKKPSRWDPSESYWSSNVTSVQVTNLGCTVRYGMNRIVALVSELSSGKAVEGAKVWAYNDKTSDADVIKKSGFAAVTDKNGLAVIEIPQNQTSRAYTNSYWNAPAILVEKDDDKILFEPENHYPWRSGIYSYGGVPTKIDAKPRIFMFSDRGLYKPGEKVSFRGLDRNQILGSFVPYNGDFSVELSDNSWRNPKVFGKIEGKTSENGGFYGDFEIPEDVEPGIYKLSYKRADGTEKILTINVAFFERLKFQSAVGMPATPVILGEKLQAKLSASYLAGGVLSGAKYEANWFREPWYFASDESEFNQYRFGPIDRGEGRNHIGEDSGALNANGAANLSCETAGSSIKGAPYRYRLSASVTDVSNQQISAAGSAVVHPASFYLGLSKPEMKTAFAQKGEKLTFTYKMATPDGKAVSSEKNASLLSGGAKKLGVKLSREEWTIVQQQGIADIYSRYEKTEVTESEESVNLSKDGKISVTPKEPGYHKIQISSTDNGGRAVITEYEFFVTGSGKVSWYQDDAVSLRLTPDKNQYKPGETAHLLLESNLPEGNYLITVEREGIFTEEVRHLSGPIHVIDVPVARNYVPVFYVSISSYSVRTEAPNHEYGEADLDKPKGYYGAAQIFVNPRVKSFSVDVAPSKISYRPGEEAEVTLVATKGGKPLANAELTLMAIDRGVLDLIDYHVPDPIDFFYNIGNFPLQVKGGDSREYLMDPVTYEVKNLKGGDNGEDGKMDERSDFNPTAIFEPMLKTDENGKVTAKFTLPDTLTTYRITAFGVSGELLALQEDEIAVQNPINMQQVLPRQLRERDTAEVGVLLTNLDDTAHDLTVSLDFRKTDKEKADENGIGMRDGKASVDGTSEKSISLESGENATVYFDLAAETSGIISLEFTIKSDILNEKLITPLKIEKPYIFETVTTTGQISDDESGALEKIAIPSFAQDMNGSVSVTLDATRLGLLGETVKYLFEYPYGCMEQQSARVLPLVIFEDYIDAFNLDSDVQDIRKCVKSFFKDWKGVQHEDGGFGYWPTSPLSNLFVSTRIAHIYALALERGYTKKDLRFDGEKLLDFIDSSLWMKNSRLFDYDKAYIYYVLALNNRSVSEERLKSLIQKENQSISVLALSGLAAFEAKNLELSSEAAKKIRRSIRPTTRGVDISNPNSFGRYFAYYGSDSESLALVLQLFTQLDKDDEMNTRLIYTLLSKQRAGYWKNTSTTARVLDSIYTVIKTNNLDKTNLSATALLGKTNFAKGDFKGAAAKPVTVTLPFVSEEIKKLAKDAEIPLEFSKKGKGSLYYTATMRYAIPEELQTPRDAGLGLVMKLYDNSTGEEILGEKDSTLVALESGKTYKVKIILSSSYDRQFIALRAPVPSGAEILDATFVTSPDDAEISENSSWRYMSNQAIYNSEIQFFWDDFIKGKTEVEYKFRAVRRGVFPTPPATAECMYESEIFGRTGGILYQIK